MPFPDADHDSDLDIQPTEEHSTPQITREVQEVALQLDSLRTQVLDVEKRLTRVMSPLEDANTEGQEDRNQASTSLGEEIACLGDTVVEIRAIIERFFPRLQV